MEVVVAGGAGDLGAAIVGGALARGFATTALIHPRTDAWRLGGLDDSVVSRVDLLDTAGVRRALTGRRDMVVVNAAACAGHPGSPGGPSRIALWQDTVSTLVSLLDALDPEAVRAVVHLGSSMQYRPSGSPLHEDGPFEPQTTRGVVKQASSTALWDWARDLGVPTAELLIFRAFGPAESPGRLLPVLLEAARTGARVPLVDTETRRDLVHVDDVVEAVFRVVERSAYGGRLNVGSGVASTVPEIVAAFESASGRRVRLEPGARPARPHDVPHWQADLTRCRQHLGWQPEISLADGMKRVWAEAGR